MCSRSATRRRGVGAAISLLALVTLATGCGGTPSQSASSDRTSAGRATASPQADASHSAGSTRASSGAGAAVPPPSSTPDADTLEPGSYDDTSGTRAHPPKSQVVVLNDMPGPTRRACVQVGDRPDVRSGAFAMGNFATAQSTFAKARSAYEAQPSFFYVIPKSAALKVVTLQMTPVSGHGRATQIRVDHVEDAAQWKYFPVHVNIPASGTWRFVVRSGAAYGCFVARFHT